MKPKAALWRLAVSGVAAVILLVLIVNVITQPVAVRKRSYVAEFTDAAGLHLGADVRVRGVPVGKVQSVELKRRDGQSIAAVEFGLDERYGVVPTTRLAIKYQALTGLRYVDVFGPAEAFSAADLVTHVPTSMTQPSFDITALFNGLQPVLATLSPDEINTFTANAVTYLNGDGGGLAPVLDSIRKLTEFVSNRQEVVATLIRNLSDVAAALNGHSDDVTQILIWFERTMDGALSVLDEMRKSDVYGPGFTAGFLRVLNNAGLKPGMTGDDVDDAIDRAITNADNFVNAFKFIPVMWQDNVLPPIDVGPPVPCAHGRAQLPEQMDVLLNGQRVVLCNR
jgi:phospholipid/cholesterol/gamma-HCH transport system substrate-binding protein